MEFPKNNTDLKILKIQISDFYFQSEKESNDEEYSQPRVLLDLDENSKQQQVLNHKDSNYSNNFNVIQRAGK